MRKQWSESQGLGYELLAGKTPEWGWKEKIKEELLKDTLKQSRTRGGGGGGGGEKATAEEPLPFTTTESASSQNQPTPTP